MYMIFKQRFFSWLDSYDIYDEKGDILFEVEGKLNWGHCLHILDANGVHVGTLKEVLLTFLPKFEIYVRDEYIGCIQKAFTLLKPRFNLDVNGWQVEGDWTEWDYRILDADGAVVAEISKNLLNWTDTYTIDVKDSQDALGVLMVVLAIDAEKCSRS